MQHLMHINFLCSITFNGSTQNEVFHEQKNFKFVEPNLTHFLKVLRFAGTILLYFIYVLLPCGIYCANKKHNIIKRAYIIPRLGIVTLVTIVLFVHFY